MERARAEALKARKKREMAGSETPSTMCGGDAWGYGDQFNRREVDEAHRRGVNDLKDRRWDGGRDRRKGGNGRERSW